MTRKYCFSAMLFLMLLCLFHKAISQTVRFRVTATILQPIEAKANHALQFSDQMTGKEINRTLINPSNAKAAKLSVSGNPNGNVFAVIPEKTLLLKCNNGQCKNEQVRLSKFQFGGSLSQNGSGQFNQKGELNDVQIGALETIPAKDKAGIYRGAVTVSFAVA